MMLTLQIALGIWFGFLFIGATVVIFIEVSEKIKKNWRYGYSWHHNWIS